jgi:hypothetical protein
VVVLKNAFFCVIFRVKELMQRQDYMLLNYAKVSRLLVDPAGAKQIRPAQPY